MAGDQNKFQAAMAHAERCSQQDNWSEAGKAYRFAMAEFPNSEAAIVGFGKAAYHLGSTKHAWQAFQQALKVNSNNAEALSYMAEIQAEMGHAEAAAQTYLRVGNVLANQRDLEGAIEAWHRATELSPDFLDAQRYLAQGLAHLGENRLAARQFLAVAALYQAQQNIPHAAQYVEMARQLLPDEPGIQAAIHALQQGNPVEPAMISETEPPPAETADTPDDMFDFDEPKVAEPQFEEDDFSPELMMPEPELMVPEEPEIEPEPEPEADPFSEDALAEFFEDETTDEQAAPEEEDPFDFFFDAPNPPAPGGGVINEARQQALSELANILFEDDPSGPETSVLPDGTQVSRMEINMMIVQAIDLQKQEDYAEAIDRYRQVVQANAGRPALYFNLGLLYQEQGNYQEAIKLLRMTSPDPSLQLSSQLALGQVYYALNDHEQALRHFGEFLKSIDLDTIDDERYDELEMAYDELPEYYLSDESTKDFEKFVEAVNQFFSKSDWERRVEEARQRLDSISEDKIMSLADFLESPETEVVITAMATSNDYLKRRLPKSASEECLRAIQRAPHYLPLHTRLADILLEQDLTHVAVDKYLAIANVYEIRRQTEQAVGVFKKILKISPLDTAVRHKLIDVQLSRNKIEPALENYVALADSYYQLAQIDKALETYDEVLQLASKASNPNQWQAKVYTQKGEIYNQRLDWSQALNYFEQAYKLDPKNEQTCRQLVDLYYKQNRTSQAIRVLDGLLKEYYQERPDKAVEFMKELVVINPEDIFLRQRLAISYVKAGHKTEAITEYDALAEMQFTQGMRDQAVQTLQTILRLRPENPEGYQQVIDQIKSGAM